MKEQSTETVTESRPVWEGLEAFARQGVQELLQRMLEEEVAAMLGRRRYARRESIDAAAGYRNGYGKPRRLSLSVGTITLRRPRLRGLRRPSAGAGAARDGQGLRLAVIPALAALLLHRLVLRLLLLDELVLDLFGALDRLDLVVEHRGLRRRRRGRRGFDAAAEAQQGGGQQGEAHGVISGFDGTISVAGVRIMHLSGEL